MAERHLRPYNSVLELIGWTPMVRLTSVTDGSPTPVYAKCEFFGPGGSIKDRIGLAMIEAAEADGTLKPGGTIVEATGGNTGLALAMAASLKGYRCICTMPDKMSSEKVKLLRAFGAEVVITPTAVPPDHPDHYLVKARSIAAETPGAVMANQFYNQANPNAHYETTGHEIWEQSEGRVTHFVASAGTGGTITGVGRYLKEKNPDVTIVGVDPEGSMIAPFFNTGEHIEGHPYKVEGIGNDKIPGTLDLGVVDEYLSFGDGPAFRMARRVSREEGLFAGGSAGLLVHAAIDVAKRIHDPDAFVVTLVCDWGERYLSKTYDDDWMRENGFLERPKRNTVLESLETKDGRIGALVTVEPTTPVRIALSAITAHDIGQLPVVRNETCIGSVTEGRLMAQVIEDPTLLDKPVESIMGAPFPVLDGHVDADEVRPLLARDNAACLVRDGGALVGIVTRYDLVRAMTA
ncbi:MAG: pyridoxal-phosphate dependent enzyme [Gemmatimonadota bacterium]|nr:pyridoxal-phosphate dependent enzyme [Gemmatimonadota bacterium]MDE3004532.1 pyridoxal-phosphate dependent enzyme [Gemmatimonadota bacterium]MDE3014971.1 pyridoxal-phosphate dependent enzyme [Gemmatimonadota bacterium]